MTTTIPRDVGAAPLGRPHLAPAPRASATRSLVKTITYRISATVYTVALAWLLFGSIEIAGAFGLIDLFANSLLYFGHERLWAWLDIRNRS